MRAENAQNAQHEWNMRAERAQTARGTIADSGQSANKFATYVRLVHGRSKRVKEPNSFKPTVDEWIRKVRTSQEKEAMETTGYADIGAGR